MTGGAYLGGELELFARAHNWKRYWASEIRRHVHGDVLEVGAGTGVNTGLLRPEDNRSWTCLEPDPRLADQAVRTFARDPHLADCRVTAATISGLEAGARFDTILYIDVLEHIEDDRAELARAAAVLRDKGHLIVLAPAHQSLYTAFDESIGHFRRYDRTRLAACSPPGGDLVRLIYLDSVGLLASIANRFLFRQSMPTIEQILFWDRVLVPQSRWLDRIVFHSIGKSILAVWQKRESRHGAVTANEASGDL